MTKTIIDVRTRAEYLSGHVTGSLNIPLQEISRRMDEIKSMDQPVLLCCASGNRSGQATSYLKSHGILCENGGNWLVVNEALSGQKNQLI